jgi:hypothetical protein
LILNLKRQTDQYKMNTRTFDQRILNFDLTSQIVVQYSIVQKNPNNIPIKKTTYLPLFEL